MLTEPTALESWAWNSHGQIQSDALMLKLSLPFQNLTSLEDYDVLVDQVPMWERKLSSLLGDMNIKYDEDSPSVSVVEYLNYLYRVVSLLKKGLLGADASTTIQPGEFKECTARILRFVSFCVIRSFYKKNWKVFVHKLSVVKEIINLNKDQITGNSSISNRYGTCQTIQAFQEFVDLGWQWKRNARQTLPWACHRHPMEKRLCHIIWVLSWAWQNYSA